MIDIQIISLFPEMFTPLNGSIPGRAQKKGLLKISYLNPRDFAVDKHNSVDGRPYGGGPGMVMKFEPLLAAIKMAKFHQKTLQPSLVSLLSPQGKKFDQKAAQELSQRKGLILIAGRYEGIDQRLINNEVDEEWSIGDFILSGGELAAMCLIDSITRLLPGALGHQESAAQDSFSKALLDYPHYTRPAKLDGQQNVPDVLLQGDHNAIARWRLKQALGRTWQRRPDLLKKHILNEQEQVLLAEFIRENSE